MTKFTSPFKNRGIEEKFPIETRESIIIDFNNWRTYKQTSRTLLYYYVINMYASKDAGFTKEDFYRYWQLLWYYQDYYLYYNGSFGDFPINNEDLSFMIKFDNAMNDGYTFYDMFTRKMLLSVSDDNFGINKPADNPLSYDDYLVSLREGNTTHNTSNGQNNSSFSFANPNAEQGTDWTKILMFVIPALLLAGGLFYYFKKIR